MRKITLMRSLSYRHLLLPAYEGAFKQRPVFRYWRQLERTQWLSRGELDRLQVESLRRLIAHAFASCPYYRQTWSQLGLDPRTLQSPEDFGRWPIVDRDTIRANRQRMRSRSPGLALIPKSTGGSSGEPLHFDLDADANAWRMAGWHRGYSWAGAAPGTRQLYLWGVPLGTRSRRKEWKDLFYNRFLYRRLVLNSFQLSEQRVPEFLERLNRYRPHAIVAYTNALHSFARALRERHLRPFSPRAIIVGAEKLHPFQRQLIEEVFAAPVFETYGSREFTLIGAECEHHNGLHINTENLLLEVLDDDGRPTRDGEEGNVVVTDLRNYGMPFVRYAIGDRALAGFGGCRCGRGLPLLKKIVGRQADVLHTPDGRRITGLFFPHVMKDFPAVRRFQVVQDAPAHVEVRLVVSDAWRAHDQESLRRTIRGTLGPAVRLDLVQTKDIPLTAAGKHRVVINLCAGSNAYASSADQQ